MFFCFWWGIWFLYVLILRGSSWFRSKANLFRALFCRRVFSWGFLDFPRFWDCSHWFQYTNLILWFVWLLRRFLWRNEPLLCWICVGSAWQGCRNHPQCSGYASTGAISSFRLCRNERERRLVAIICLSSLAYRNLDHTLQWQWVCRSFYWL